MERRVIKINLVGLICTVILIISAIVGIIAFAISHGNDGSGKGNSDKGKETLDEVQQSNENIENNIKEVVTIGNETREISLKRFDSKLNYNMNYANEIFYIDKNSNEKDLLKSLESDTVYIEIERFEDGFVKKSSELISNEVKKMKADDSYRMDTKDLNGRLCYIEQYKKDEDLYMDYFIENGKSYYHAKIHIGKAFIDMDKPIIEKMMLSFTTI